MLALVTLVACAFPPGSVVAGVSTIDGTATDIVVVTPAGEREVLGVLDHAKGRLPKGVLGDAEGALLVTTSEVLDGTHSVVELSELGGARRIVVTGAVETQVPVVVGGDVASVIEDRKDPTQFDVVLGSRKLAHFHGTWLTPASTSSPSTTTTTSTSTSSLTTSVTTSLTYLAIDLDGTNRIVSLDAFPRATKPSALETRATFGKGRYRSPAVVGAELLLERDIDAGHAEIVDAGGAVLQTGLPGMDPRACAGGVGGTGEPAFVAIGNGKKGAGVVIAHVARGKLVDAREIAAVDAGDRAVAGVTTPLACSVVGGQPVVVAWVSKGASLPGELWVFSSSTSQRSAARRLLEPEVGAAVEVYGVTR